MAKVFFSYSHRDEKMRDELEVHLSMLKREGVIESWHDRRIDAGSELDNSIDVNLEDSDIVLLLVSPYFLASDYCYDKEMAKAMEMHNAGQAKVIPIILEYCEWDKALFGKLLAIPKDGKPVSSYPNYNEAFFEITKEIRKVAENTCQTRPQHSAQATTVQEDTVPIGAQKNVRSSNLRLKKQFSDYEKNKFLTDAFEYMAKFFCNSLKELEKRNKGIQCDYRRVDTNTFTVTLYQSGKEISHCKIRYSGDSFLNGITYSSSVNDNSINESLSVEDDGYILYLKSLMDIMGTTKDEKLSFEGASEYYWCRLIEPLQR